ncbi:sigma-70 family RNA polymerase sigma factor [Clostridioides sp. ZZV15-6383]|uniref:sigma-70 family RNA polymerase sigma factor n=1 Tax=Clostridioides sp. ZZV15-6383 TaxID=2811498 RepID=UPI001D0FA08F
MAALKSFEKPLTPEEEIEYLTKFKIENDKSAKDTLIERNMRLVAYIAKKYNNSTEDQDDLISIGTIGLIKAIETYNIDKGTRLATYASRCIENEILMNIRSNKKNKTQVSLQDPIGTDKEGNEINTTFYMLFPTIVYIYLLYKIIPLQNASLKSLKLKYI